MVFKIVWTPKALQSYLRVIKYLEENWSEKQAKDFSHVVEERITTLSQQPNIGISRSKKDSLRSIVLHKRILLIYKVKPAKQEIELSLFWNTYQNPRKLIAK